MNKNFLYLVQLFQRLPGVGPRQAARFILSLIKKPQKELEEFGTAILELKHSVKLCPECFNLTDDHLCVICSKNGRDASKMLVVEKVTDLDSIERTGLYKGLYHVLGGAIDPIEEMVPERLTIDHLKTRMNDLGKGRKTVELILATNPTTAGETTALYLEDVFSKDKNIIITRLGRGLASGTNLEYIDELTLKHALERRR